MIAIFIEMQKNLVTETVRGMNEMRKEFAFLRMNLPNSATSQTIPFSLPIKTTADFQSALTKLQDQSVYSNMVSLCGAGFY